MSKSELLRLAIQRGEPRPDMNEREKFDAWWIHEGTFCDNTFTHKKETALSCWQSCAEQKEVEIAELKEELTKHQASEFHPDWSMLEACMDGNKELTTELQELKQEINRVWALAYPESPADSKDVAKLRIYNLYQDLECHRFNLRVLNKAYNELEGKK